MNEVLLTGAARTAIGDLNGVLAAVNAVELGKASACASLARAGIAADKIDEVIIGNVLQAGLGQNPARQIAIGCGIPREAVSFTVNQVCGSGLKAIELAWRQVASGASGAVLAGGAESMSGAPYILPAMRGGARLGDRPALDTVLCDGLTDAFHRYHMGMTAENVAEKYGISRQAQDEFALASQHKCGKAVCDGRFADEIVPVIIKGKKQDTVVSRDEHPRPELSIADLARLKPAFKPDGTVTPGNASGINDGAATVIVLDGKLAAELGVPRSGCVRIRAAAGCGYAPELMGAAPVPAVRKLLAQQGLHVNDIDLWELNEAFAAQSVAVIGELGLDPARVNVNGGAIALGHPIGASGARIVVSLFHEMKRRNAPLGVASLCIGGGMAMAVLLENI